MNLQGKKVTLHDMSLRDGMHPKRHQISLEQMVAVATGLDLAGVPLVEVTHGDGLGGSSINYGFPAHTDEQYLRAVVPKLTRAKVSALLLPGIGTVDHLRMAADCGVGTIRVATHCTEADVSGQHIGVSSECMIVRHADHAYWSVAGTLGLLIPETLRPNPILRVRRLSDEVKLAAE